MTASERSNVPDRRWISVYAKDVVVSKKVRSKK